MYRYVNIYIYVYNNLVIPSPTSLTYPWYLTKETKYHHALLTNLVEHGTCKINPSEKEMFLLDTHHFQVPC